MGTPAPSDKPSRLEEIRSEFSPAVSESVLVLRATQSMVLPLRTASTQGQPALQVAVRTRAIGTPALTIPFCVSRTVTDPATKIKVSVGLTVESGLASETVRLVVECDPIPQDRTWKVSLQDAEREHKHIEAEKLKTDIGRKLRQMVRENRTRMDYLKKFQEMIDEYNSGSSNIEELFKKLTAFAQALNEEEKRAISEQLTEEELALFDVLTKPEPTLKRSEEMQVKKVAHELLETLKREKLVLDWRKRQQARAAVRTAIEDILDELPEAPYPKDIYDHKCELVYRHFYDSYFGENRSVYAPRVN